MAYQPLGHDDGDDWDSKVDGESFYFISLLSVSLVFLHYLFYGNKF